MNVDNIRLLIERLRTVEHSVERTPTQQTNKFWMNVLTYECGTPACIAGWAAWYALEMPETMTPINTNIERRAAEWLGLDYSWCMSYLFYPSAWLFWDAIQPEHAIAALQNILDAGPNNYEVLTGPLLWGMTRDEITEVEAQWNEHSDETEWVEA